MSIHQAIVKARFDAACRMLLEGESIKKVAFDLGYAQVSNFVYAFRRRFGVPPGEWLMLSKQKRE